MGGQWEAPDWEEPEAAWTLMDELERRALPALNRTRRPTLADAVYALVRTLAAPLTAARWRRRVRRSASCPPADHR